MAATEIIRQVHQEFIAAGKINFPPDDISGDADDEFWDEVHRRLSDDLLEALDIEFERLHPRGRAGRFIRKLGLKMYEVGGAVRDPLLGKPPKDVDYVAVAAPEEIKRAVEDAGGRAEDLTVRDRLVGVRAHHPDLPKEGVEIAPPRIENSTGGGRHNFEIVPHPAVTGEQKVYHVAPRSARDSIEAHGIDASRSEFDRWSEGESGFYAFADPGEAKWYAEMMAAEPPASAMDVYEVPLTTDALPDPGLGPEGPTSSVHVLDPVPPGKAKLVTDLPTLEADPVPLADPITDDAHRRDFTINALYRDPDTGDIQDPTGKGLADLSNRVLRTTHPDSFRDDPLRILRGARFASQHDLDVEPETFAQMQAHADAVTGLTQKGVSGTVREELDKLLMGENPGKGLRVLRDSDVLGHLLPELEPMVGFDQESKYHNLSADEHTIRVVEGVAEQGGSLEARLAALFHDSGKPESAWRGKDGKLHYYGNPEEGKRDHALIGAEKAEEALRRLNYPTDVIKDVTTLIREHMLTDSKKPKPSKARKLRTRMTDKQLDDLFIHRRADLAAKGEDDEGAETESKHPSIDVLEKMVRENAGAPRSIEDLEISGADLLERGWKPGPGIGAFLRRVFGEVVGQPSLNNRDWLFAQAEKRRREFQDE